MSNYLTTTFLFTALFHVSNLMAFLAFLFRDQLQLRLMMAVSFVLQGLYYYAIPGGPFFDPLFWKVVSFAANMAMIILVFGGKLDFGIPADLRPLYEKIRVLTPGQFRKLARITSRETGHEKPLLVEGERPTHLYYLLQGQARLSKANRSEIISQDMFLGEIAFLNAAPASATVQLLPESLCASWDSAALHKLMQQDKSVDIAMRGVFNHDLASKVAASMPLPRAGDVTHA
jgi:Cyclic nucleotide-binding domain